MAMAILLLVEAPSGWSQQYYLYSPTAVGPEGKAPGKDGVLVQDVSVQKGDTLYGISRRFSGHGTYYPQILLFNDIKDPNRIYPGNVFKIPVPRNAVSGHVDKGAVKNDSAAVPPVQKQEPVTPSAAAVTDISTQDLKKVDIGREKKRAAKGKSAVAAKKQVATEKHHAATADTGNSVSGQKLFERAVKAYRQDEYRSALELFDRYLAENQSSPLAADASLYKAECYLKLSSQN
jgi:LysM repeat protein